MGVGRVNYVIAGVIATWGRSGLSRDDIISPGDAS